MIRETKRFLFTCIILFALFTALKLHGSSVILWKMILNDDKRPNGLLLSTPKTIRSDEFEVWTPAVIAQSRSTPSFPSENPSLGSGKVPLLYSMPVRHYTMIFRPQLWGFFILDFEHGYAWYWNFKIFGLLTGMYLLFLLLTSNPFVSICGSLIMLFSCYIQWWFSCPPMLPEMLTSWAFAMICAISIFTSATGPKRLLSAGGFIVAMLNFSLCMYPPFQIQLVYLGVIISIGYLWEHRSRIPRMYAGLSCLLAALLLFAAALIPVLIECLPTFRTLASTVYPGMRYSTGGDFNILRTMSGMLNFFISEKSYPESFDEVNDSANLYPLWIPAAAVLLWSIFKNRRLPVLDTAIAVYMLCLMFFVVCGMPRWLCSLTFLSSTTEARCLLGIGMAGIILAVNVIGDAINRDIWPSRKYSVLSALILFAGTTAYLIYARQLNPGFLSTANTVLILVINAVLIPGFLIIPRRYYLLLLAGVLCASNAFVNPVMYGMDPLLKATPLAEIKRLHAGDPEGAWVAYESNELSQFLISSGARTISGMKIVPDMDFFRPIDPGQEKSNEYNRYSFLYFRMNTGTNSVDIDYAAFPTTLITINPLHPAFKEWGVRYFMFPFRLYGIDPESLEPVSSMPQHGIWIYRRR